VPRSLLVEAKPCLNSTGEFIIAYDSLEAAAAGAEESAVSMSSRAARSQIRMVESEVGIRLAVTRQKAGRTGDRGRRIGAGDDKRPRWCLSVADVIVVSGSCKDWRLVARAFAIAGELAIASQAKQAHSRPDEIRSMKHSVLPDC